MHHYSGLASGDTESVRTLPSDKEILKLQFKPKGRYVAWSAMYSLGHQEISLRLYARSLGYVSKHCLQLTRTIWLPRNVLSVQEKRTWTPAWQGCCIVQGENNSVAAIMTGPLHNRLVNPQSRPYYAHSWKHEQCQINGIGSSV